MGRYHGNQILAIIGQNITKMAIGPNLSCMQHIHAEFGFEIRFVVFGNSSVTPRTQGTKGHYHDNQFSD